MSKVDNIEQKVIKIIADNQGKKLKKSARTRDLQKI